MQAQTMQRHHARGTAVNDRMRRNRDDCDRIAETFTRLKRVLPELERRTRFAAGNDGYPAASMGGGGGQTGTVSTPTERAALAGHEPDPVRAATKTAMRALREAMELVRSVENALAMAGDLMPACDDCGRTDVSRLVSGRCEGCRSRVRRGGQS